MDLHLWLTIALAIPTGIVATLLLLGIGGFVIAALFGSKMRLPCAGMAEAIVGSDDGSSRPACCGGSGDA